MAGYLFYPPADAAQDLIWKTTAETWGDAQAETYILGLHRHLQRLSETRALWRKLPSALTIPADLDIEAWFSRYEHHYVIFRTLSGARIGVISILHERMDLPVRLTDDLLSIARRNAE